MSAALALALMACDQFSSELRIGISLPPDGSTPSIHYLSCPGELVLGVSLSEFQGEPGSRSETVLWEIRSAAGSTIQSFVPGETPPGFTEEVAFAGSLPEDADLVAAIETNGEIGAALDFAASDLVSGKVLVRKQGNIDRAVFEATAKDSCSRR